MAYYKLTQGKLTDIEKILSEVKPYELKKVATNIYQLNFDRLKNHFLTLFFGSVSLYKGTWCYSHKHAVKDAETTLKLDNAETVGHFYHTLKDKPLLSVSNMLNSEEEIDMKTAYEAKEVLYKAQSYLVGYKLGYTDVTLNYSELKDLEYLIGLYESGDLFDLVDKYNNA